MTRVTGRLASLIAKPWVAPTGRIKNYLHNPERKTYAPACMLRLYNNDLGHILKSISTYTKKGAGVKVHLNHFKRREPSVFDWYFTLYTKHRDFDKMPEFLKSNYLSPDRVYDQEIFNRNTEIIIIEDTMESIEESWSRFIDAAAQGKTIVLDPSKIRPSGCSSTSGVVSTGLFGLSDTNEGFMSVYAWLAEHLRDGKIGSLIKLLGGMSKVIARGGLHKNGIVTTSINFDHEDVFEYLNYPLSEVAGGSKKGIRFNTDILSDKELCTLVIKKVNEESLMLEKIIDEDLYLNVCMGLLLQDKGSCLTMPANAGMCKKPQDLINALCDTTEILCIIHNTWREQTDASPEFYSSLEEDRQIGVTWLGWANFLGIQGVSYKTHVETLRHYRLKSPREDYNEEEKRGYEIAKYLNEAYKQASTIVKEYDLDRAFGIEPTQRCYVDFKDLKGFTTCRNIDPPFERLQQRDSEIHGDVIYDHGEVEVIREVGHQLHQDHWEEFQMIMDETGYSHAGSFNWYEKLTYERFENFVEESPLISSYYMQAQQVEQSYLNKGQIIIACEDEDSCSVCGN